MVMEPLYKSATHRIPRTRIWGLLILFIMCSSLFGEISQSLEGADSLNVGTPFTFRIKASYSIRQVSIPDSLEDFTIIGSKQFDKRTNEWELKIVPLRTGPLSFPRLQVQPEIPAFPAEYTDGFRVNVISVLAEGDTLLRDIKPLKRYPLQAPFWFYSLLLLIAVLLAVLLIRKRHFKPKNTAKPASEPVPIRTPAWQKAIEELEQLLSSDLLGKGELILFHFRLSQVLRAFLESEYDFPALEMTTRELSIEMQRQQIRKSGEIRLWLQYCDLVKFAKSNPSAEDIEYRCQWLRQYLQSFAKLQEPESDA